MTDYKRYKGECLSHIGVSAIPAVRCFILGSAPKRWEDVDYKTYDAQGIQPPRGGLPHCGGATEAS